MNIDIVNFARNEKPKALRWFIAEQLPAWIRLMLQGKDDGHDCGDLIEQLASVCCIERKAQP